MKMSVNDTQEPQEIKPFYFEGKQPWVRPWEDLEATARSALPWTPPQDSRADHPGTPSTGEGFPRNEHHPTECLIKVDANMSMPHWWLSQLQRKITGDRVSTGTAAHSGLPLRC